MGKVKQTRRMLAKFFNWRVSVTLTDGRVLVGTLMAVDKHVNLVLCNTEEYRKYKVKGKPEGKELKRMLGFIVCRGNGVLYVQPEEIGKEELVETDGKKKFKAAPKAAAPAPKLGGPPGMPGMPGAPGGPGPMMLPPGLLAQMPGLRMPTLPSGLPGMPKSGMPGLPGIPGLPGLGGLAGMTGMPGLNPAMLGKAPGMMGTRPMGLPGLFPGAPGGAPGGMRPPMPGGAS